MKVPYLVNITGLGSAMEGEGLLQKLTSFLYRIAVKKADCVFFQNEMNRQVFEKRNIHGRDEELLPGSGVNLEHFSYMEMPSGERTEFVYISRVMKEKGIEEYLSAAKILRKKYPDTRFHILGFCEEEYEERLKVLQEKGIIEYHGMQEDVRVFLKRTHCLVHPSFYPEGMSNVCLEDPLILFLPRNNAIENAFWLTPIWQAARMMLSNVLSVPSGSITYTGRRLWLRLCSTGL